MTATRIAAGELNGFVRVGAGSTGYNLGWSLALLGAGHLVGLSVGMAMLVGQVISWVIAVPILTAMQPATIDQTLAAHTTVIWRTQVRFIGAGVIAVAAIYTLARLSKPVIAGLVNTLAAHRAAATGDDRDRDISPPWILALTAACLVIAAWLAFTFARSTVLAPSALTLTLITVPFVLIIGFVIAGVCGYMAGLIGASNSPISGVGILSIVICASVFALAVTPTPETRPALVAIALARASPYQLPPATAKDGSATANRDWSVYLAICLSGFSALGAEVEAGPRAPPGRARRQPRAGPPPR